MWGDQKEMWQLWECEKVIEHMNPSVPARAEFSSEVREELTGNAQIFIIF